MTYAFDADQTFRYAEASGDPMPIHLDDAVARSVGLPGIIIHGLCTMAFCGRAVIDSVAGGDPTRLARLAVKFSRPVLPGQEITVRIYAARRRLRLRGPQRRGPGRGEGRPRRAAPMSRLVLFARAREAAGRKSDDIDAATLGELLDRAVAAYGAEFGAVLEISRVWVNGDEPTDGLNTPVGPNDEVAVLPPVSGG